MHLPFGGDREGAEVSGRTSLTGKVEQLMPKRLIWSHQHARQALQISHSQKTTLLILKRHAILKEKAKHHDSYTVMWNL